MGFDKYIMACATILVSYSRIALETISSPLLVLSLSVPLVTSHLFSVSVAGDLVLGDSMQPFEWVMSFSHTHLNTFVSFPC